MEFKGKTAIVTGAASGMGLLSARKLAEGGASVVLCDVNAERVEAAAEEIRRNGGKAFAVKVDVRRYEEVEAAAKAAGLTVVAVYDPFYASYEQQLRRSCDGYLKSFTELLG